MNTWLMLLFHDPERDLWCIMDDKLHVWHKTLVRTTARTTNGYTCKVLLNVNSVIYVLSFSTVMGYAA